MSKILKLFVVKKYIMATSASQALRKEKEVKADDCWVDEDWKKENTKVPIKIVGFKTK